MPKASQARASGAFPACSSREQGEHAIAPTPGHFQSQDMTVPGTEPLHPELTTKPCPLCKPQRRLTGALGGQGSVLGKDSQAFLMDSHMNVVFVLEQVRSTRREANGCWLCFHTGLVNVAVFNIPAKTRMNNTQTPTRIARMDQPGAGL